MPIALWCVLVAAVLPIVCVGIAKAKGPRYDNRNPRAWLAQETYLTSSRMARSSPSSVSGNMRSPTSWRISEIECVYCQ